MSLCHRRGADRALGCFKRTLLFKASILSLTAFLAGQGARCPQLEQLMQGRIEMDRQTGRRVALSGWCLFLQPLLTTALFCLTPSSSLEFLGAVVNPDSAVPGVGLPQLHAPGFYKAAPGRIPGRPLRQNKSCLWLCLGL